MTDPMTAPTDLAAALLRPVVARHIAALPALSRMCLPDGFVEDLPADLASVLASVIRAVLAEQSAARARISPHSHGFVNTNPHHVCCSCVREATP